MLNVNQRNYKLPSQPTVVVCVDGCEPDYVGQAVATGQMPWMQGVLAQGTSIVADCVVPTFTNPNKDRKSTRLNSSHVSESRMPSSA